MTAHLQGKSRWLALVILCLGDLMIVLDSTVVNVALPSIRSDLGFTETSLVWVVNAYLLTYGGFLLLGGRLGDLYGHRRLFLYGIVFFTLASLACGLATTQTLLIAARAIQGLGGAVVSAVALSLIMLLFTEDAERAKAMGVFGFVMAGGGTVGVLMGGLLTDALNWHWVFLVNIPIGALVFALCLALVPDDHAGEKNETLDVAGAITVTLSLLLAVYAIVDGNEAGWGSLQTIGLLALAAALMALFLVIELKVSHPLMPLGLFQLAQPVGRQHRRRAVGGGDVRLVLPVGALHAAGAELHADGGGPGLPAGQPDHGRVLARAVGQAGDALRHPRAAGDRAAAGGGGPRAVRARSRGRRVLDRRDAGHDPARARRRHRLQPDPAGGDERRRAARSRGWPRAWSTPPS